jgi:hypothetical protein
LQRHKPYRMLKQLPVPEQPWNSISMDFIEKLPPPVGFDTILVIAGSFTKQYLFILMYDTITSIMLAKLFVLHVFSKHGVPSHVPLNVDRNSCHRFSTPSERHSTWSSISHLRLSPRR